MSPSVNCSLLSPNLNNTGHRKAGSKLKFTAFFRVIVSKFSAYLVLVYDTNEPSLSQLFYFLLLYVSGAECSPSLAFYTTSSDERFRPTIFPEGTRYTSTGSFRRRGQTIGEHWSSTPETLKPVDFASDLTRKKARLLDLQVGVCALFV